MDEHKYCKKLLGIFCRKHVQRCWLCLYPVLPEDPHIIRRDSHDDCIVRWYTNQIMNKCRTPTRIKEND